MRSILRSNKFDATGNPTEYNPWGDAKPELINEIGDFCSYCGKHLTRSALHIEHIQDKDTHSHLQFFWNNFLLACVNCNSTKLKKNPITLNAFLPHLDNLLCFIEVLNGGLLQVKTGVTGTNLTRTNAFINLVGLDRRPGHANYSDKDDRWEYRLTAYDKATRQLQKYTSTPVTTDIENITELAITAGFFSVWFTVFAAHDSVKAALITAFKGTKSVRFNARNHYLPI
jgi:uncharacterized protein (TIGR02646 family)